MKNFSATAKQLLNFRYIRNNPLLSVVYILILIGIYFVFNATVVSSLDLFNTPYHFGILHLAWVSVGFLFFIYFYSCNLFKIRKLTQIIFYISFISLFLLAVAKFFPCDSVPFAPCNKGAIRWLVLNPRPLPEIPFIGSVSFQPAEIAKLALVLLVSMYLTKETLTFEQKLKKILIAAVFLISFVFIQPNKSTSIIMVAICISIYLVYGEKTNYLLYLIPVLAVIYIFFIFYNSYSLNRVKTYLDVNASDDQNYHQNQIQISLGSGGLFGIGLGKSRQKFSFLPEISSDSIFAVIGEESGFVGTAFVTSLVFYLIYLGFKIAEVQHEMYYKLLATGITTWFGVQSLINLFAMTQIMPLTGVPLPLISYGGSSTIFMMTALGILGNISRSVYEKRFK
jgi:cell division protein FtsW